MGLLRTSRNAVAVLAGTLACVSAGAADDARRSFVSCPIIRDTASVPCWLSEYQGELYFLTLQTDVSAPVTPPWLGHRVLVEGVVSNEPRICGGIVLKPVRLSVLPQLDAACNTVLPAEARYNLTFEPPRPPGPSSGRLAFDTAPPGAAPAARDAPAVAVARTVREFVIPYSFDGLVAFGHPRFVTPIIEYALAVNARTIEIVGYRGAARLSDGQLLVETADIGKRRAEQIAVILRGADLTAPAYSVRWIDAPATVTGTDDFETRRVVVTVRPD